MYADQTWEKIYLTEQWDVLLHVVMSCAMTAPTFCHHICAASAAAMRRCGDAAVQWEPQHDVQHVHGLAAQLLLTRSRPFAAQDTL